MYSLCQLLIYFNRKSFKILLPYIVLTCITGKVEHNSIVNKLQYTMWNFSSWLAYHITPTGTNTVRYAVYFGTDTHNTMSVFTLLSDLLPTVYLA